MTYIELTNVIEGAAKRVLRHDGVPVDGTAGTYAGAARPGDQVVNTATGIVYVNTGTQASPTWTVVGTQT